MIRGVWGIPQKEEVISCLKAKLIHPYPTDSSTYATFLFNAFDTNHDGSVSFEVSWRRVGQGGLFLGASGPGSIGQAHIGDWVKGI